MSTFTRDDDPNWDDDPNRPIIPRPGSELDPANFVGRRLETRRAIEMLHIGHRLILSDPRRLGKTFWMVKLADEVNRSGQFKMIRIDYQGVSTMEGFLGSTVAGLVRSQSVPARFVQYVKGLFDNVEVDTGPVTLKHSAATADPLAHLKALFYRLNDDIAKLSTVPYVIAMDEVPDAVWAIAGTGNPIHGRTLLQLLRHLRQEMPHLRWIVAGSIGFHHAFKACQTTSAVINDLQYFPFGPLNPDEAAVLTKRLALGIERDIDDDAVETMVGITDGIPYLIQELCYRMRGDSGPITPDEIRVQFKAFATDSDLGSSASHFLTRMETYYHGDDLELAYAILDWFAQAPPGWLARDDMPIALRQSRGLRGALDKLISDHYLTSNTDGKIKWRYEAIGQIYRLRRLES